MKDPSALDLLGAKNLMLNILAGNLDDKGPSFRKLRCLDARTVTQEFPAGTGQ
jgi:hypothetical protein